jgi:hypothetical protein
MVEGMSQRDGASYYARHAGEGMYPASWWQSGHRGFQIGDQVYGYASRLSGGSGSFAEFVAAKRTTLARAPKNTGFVEAASAPSQTFN